MHLILNTKYLMAKGASAFLLVCLLTSFSFHATGQSSAEELAKKLANPIASLISIPLQNNSDFGIGEWEGSRNTLNVQPVVPFKLSEKLNLITRYIVPVISQYSISAPGERQAGLGDAVISAFVSPVNDKSFTWGAGPVFLVPTGTDDLLTTDKFGVGPTAVFLNQQNGWTYGALANQIWSIAGNEDRGDVSQLFFQPFLIKNFKSGAGLGMNFELTQNWSAENTTLWWNPFINGVTAIGKQKVQLGIGPRFNLIAPDSAKARWGVRAVVIFLFPK